MPDRIIREELLQSSRWLDLQSDTHRLVYAALILSADDFGNFEGGPRRLYRWMIHFAQVKTEADSTKIMIDLQDSDLVRRYEIDGKEYWHLPRFKNSRRYWARKCPASPYPEQDHKTTAEQLQEKQGAAENPAADLPQTCRRPAASLARGVGVGVGVGVGETLPSQDGKLVSRGAPWE